MKQAKVSMVIPCYNKERFIGDMLRSVYEQIWDNIELILVNDGSTDGTREIISQWEPRLRERGFDVIVIDQENAGVITAARTGLERITGEFVCQVDADDELDPAFVSTTAGWLEKNPDYDFAICDYVLYFRCGDRKIFYPFLPIKCDRDFRNATEQFLINDQFVEVWLYMVRTEYFYKCGVLENYTTTNRWSHEPGYAIPIHALGGKFRYFPLPLYHYHMCGDGMSQNKSYVRYEKYITEHNKLCKEAIHALPESTIGFARKQSLLTVAEFSLVKRLYSSLNNYPDGPEHRGRVVKSLLDFANSFFNTQYTIEQIAGKEQDLALALTNEFTDKEIKKPPEIPGRIIAYGAKGKRGSRLIPLLRGTELEPTILWDAAADGTSELFGIPLEKPNFDDLLETDTILILPADKAVVNKILESCRGVQPHNILFFEDVYDYVLHKLYFPESRV